MMAEKCARCGATGASKLCSRCKNAHYCNRACQAAHWKSTHRKECRRGDLPPEIKVGSEHLYLPDDIAQKMESIQGVPFLRTGVPPAVGQRVEVRLGLKDHRDVHFRLSGKVVEVPGEPSDVRPMKNENDYGPGKGSMQLANYMGLNNVTNYDPVQCALYFDPDNHNRYDPSRYKSRFDEGLQVMRDHYGMLHGQEVVCEARLNYDWDMRRGTEDGPWSDSIPFDGRDVWRFSLVADDSAGCMWIPEPDSFVNLGRHNHHRPRGWPWNEAVVELPYARTGADLPFDVRRSGSSIATHMCLGPFGCDGSDHRHSF